MSIMCVINKDFQDFFTGNTGKQKKNTVYTQETWNKRRTKSKNAVFESVNEAIQIDL